MGADFFFRFRHSWCQTHVRGGHSYDWPCWWVELAQDRLAVTVWIQPLDRPSSLFALLGSLYSMLLAVRLMRFIVYLRPEIRDQRSTTPARC